MSSIGNKRPFNKLMPLNFENIEIIDKFWSTRQKINREISIYSQYEKLEINHHIDNFRVASGLKKGITRGLFYLDSDLYKWLEGASYILNQYKDANLERKVQEIVKLIEKVQMKDGYVNTYYSTKFPERRLTFIHITHELYCAGHLFQAAIAHYKATGKKELLNVAIKFADLLVKLYLPKKRIGAPGHEEIEMALVELYRITGEKKYLDLAIDFIERRGLIPHFKKYAIRAYIDMITVLKKAKKIEKRYEKKQHQTMKQLNSKEESPEYILKVSIADVFRLFKENYNGKLYQLHKPIREMNEPVGHAVRAMYLYCAIADVYSEIGDKSLLKALELIWLKMIKSRMYITGGIGSVRIIEGFGKDFKLKPENSYSETCAAIGSLMWNWRMLQITGKAKYADLIEKLLYNAMLVGQSIDGKKYTYSNPLVSSGQNKRQEWFICACCPPNIVRTIASLGKYIYSTSGKDIWIHQYIGSRAKIQLNNNGIVELVQESNFPWNGSIKITVNQKYNRNFSIFFRIPAWCSNADLRINRESFNGLLSSRHYIEIVRNWSNNDLIELKFPIKPKIEFGDSRIKATRGKVAISCGPIIYCLEQKDNKEFDIFKARISKNPELKIKFEPDLLGGINVIRGYLSSKEKFTAIPYYAWCNRGPTKMIVWIKSERKS
ncbi:MAG: glycoside hydrolase family 127 protein [Promethearchaeota archaeon]